MSDLAEIVVVTAILAVTSVIYYQMGVRVGRIRGATREDKEMIEAPVPRADAHEAFVELIGNLRREANHIGVFGQSERLHRLADQLVRTEVQMRTEVLKALGLDTDRLPWNRLVERIAAVVEVNLRNGWDEVKR